jgi:hypothetical protein
MTKHLAIKILRGPWLTGEGMEGELPIKTTSQQGVFWILAPVHRAAPAKYFKQL